MGRVRVRVRVMDRVRVRILGRVRVRVRVMDRVRVSVWVLVRVRVHNIGRTMSIILQSFLSSVDHGVSPISLTSCGIRYFISSVKAKSIMICNYRHR